MAGKVAVIGLGDIARKAYLPTITARAGLDLHLMTRNPARLADVADQYRVPEPRRFTDLDELLAHGLDAAFVHVPTTAHAATVRRLLAAGVPTYVDKPLDDSLAGARALVELAERLGVPLMVGFNRRYVPAYAEAARGARDLVVLQKNQDGGSGGVREIVFDDFIHVVDTLRFLVPGPIERTFIGGVVTEGELEQVSLTVVGGGFTAIGTMHRRAGAKQERLEVTGGGVKVEVTDLGQVTRHEGGRVTRQTEDGWAPVARRRGIEQVCTAFLAGELPDLREALRTHELCEQVVTELTEGGAVG
ncbi:Gfo/Idh/MocA family oxidoreductase [Crossiella sp. CA-258035]|uniref:Gfo/Idh/MocA family protein n=1 Tax=Crossiella sp. CA-258035 TaxID=2981138 RepID=UPI0024BC4600|nr:Gfo/Idh/MocA family oxidoreductase [Crossiella sp. CA-258035]WHT17005.1 Gfo/Idh/MocA family oxidoreductase [Crossiella sp. CA-258035]